MPVTEGSQEFQYERATEVSICESGAGAAPESEDMLDSVTRGLNIKSNGDVINRWI